MAEKSVELSEKEAAYIVGILTARQQIERDYSTAAGMAFARGGIDLQPDSKFRFEGKSLIVEVADEPLEPEKEIKPLELSA